MNTVEIPASIRVKVNTTSIAISIDSVVMVFAQVNARVSIGSNQAGFFLAAHSFGYDNRCRVLTASNDYPERNYGMR